MSGVGAYFYIWERKRLLRVTFYTNTTFYVLIRQLEVSKYLVSFPAVSKDHLQLLYSRLHLFKSIANSAISDPTSYKPVPIAQSLGVLNDLSALGERAHDAPHYYDLFLESCEKLFDNQMEQHVFEDIMRYMFGIKVRLFGGYRSLKILLKLT